MLKDELDLDNLSDERMPDDFDVLATRELVPKLVIKLMCNCPWVAQYHNDEFRDETCMYVTKCSDGESCDFCGHAVFKDNLNGKTKKSYKNTLRGPTVYRRFEKPRRSVSISDWHKTGKR